MQTPEHPDDSASGQTGKSRGLFSLPEEDESRKAEREKVEGRRMTGGLVILCVIIVILAVDFIGGAMRRSRTIKTVKEIAAQVEALPRAEFAWRALWAHPTAKPDEIRAMVDLTARMGCNVLIIGVNDTQGTAWYRSSVLPLHKDITEDADPLKMAVEEAGKKNIRVYAWVITHVRDAKDFTEAHPEWLQQVLPDEEALVGTERTNPDRLPIHGGGWVCPDRGLLDYQKQMLQEIASHYDVEGIAIDYLGYRNYYACFCDYSKAERAEFARTARSVRQKEVLREFSEVSMIAWTERAREAVLEVKPEAKLAIHIYPDFDPNPLYGNMLPVDYCGQTVAWFYTPFWTYEAIAAKAAAVMNAEGQYHGFNRAVPFIGVAGRDRLKTPDRLRKEIRIAGAAGAERIMLAFYETFAENQMLAAVVSEEFAPPSATATAAE